MCDNLKTQKETAEETNPLQVTNTMQNFLTPVSTSEPAIAPSDLPVEKTFLSETDPASSQPGTSTAHTVTDIPSPFKRHLFFKKQTEVPPKKRTTQEKIPAIVSGHNFQQYLKKKQQKKEESEKATFERVAERERKRKEKELEKDLKKIAREAKKNKLS